MIFQRFIQQMGFVMLATTFASLPAYALETSRYALPKAPMVDVLPTVLADPFASQEKITPYGKNLKPATCPPPPDISQPISLNEAVTAAICHNPDARIAYLTLITSAYSRDSTIMSFLPDITASGSAGTTRSDGNARSKPRVSQSSGIDISTGMVLYDFGKREATLENAERSLVSSGLSYDASLQGFISNSMNGYFSLLRAQNGLIIEKEQFDLAKTTLDAAEIRYKLGLTPEIDVLQARASLSDAELALESAQNTLDLAQAALLELMGFPPLQKVVVREIDDSNLLERPFNSPVAELIAKAKEQRTDMKIAKNSLQNAENSYDNVQRRGLPSISMAAERSYGDLDIINNTTRYSDSIGVSVKIPIFSGFDKMIDDRVAKKNIEKEREGIIRTERNVEQDVLESWHGYNTAARSFEIGFDSLYNANRVKETTLARYKEGLGTIVDVLSAQDSYRNAMRRHLESRYSLLTSRLRLVRAVGTLSLDTVEPSKKPVFNENPDLFPLPSPITEPKPLPELELKETTKIVEMKKPEEKMDVVGAQEFEGNMNVIDMKEPSL